MCNKQECDRKGPKKGDNCTAHSRDTVCLTFTGTMKSKWILRLEMSLQQLPSDQSSYCYSKNRRRVSTPQEAECWMISCFAVCSWVWTVKFWAQRCTVCGSPRPPPCFSNKLHYMEVRVPSCLMSHYVVTWSFLGLCSIHLSGHLRGQG